MDAFSDQSISSLTSNLKFITDVPSAHCKVAANQQGVVLQVAVSKDEDNSIISLDQEHCNGYIKDHKSDATYLNKPLAHYNEMSIIFSNTMATRKYAKSSIDPLGTEDGETEEKEDTPDDNGASSYASKPKRAKTIIDIEDDSTLVGVLKYVGEKLSNAIEKVAAPTPPPPPPPADELPEDLFNVLTSLPGFEEAHISYYYAYLVANPHIAKAFYKLPFNHKLNWVAFFIADKFPGC
ncbi:uncharacterized protein [Setaria viridis]|uniref:uncharacterized protein n=1 Tax=Setaria viridis TaxID=4556 RepID=UPI0014937361|nr:uncharacterized protein LOC117864950 [Setaria viridis]